MTSLRTIKISILAALVLLIVALIVLSAVAAPGQQGDAGQPSAKSSDVSMLVPAGMSPQGLLPVRPGTAGSQGTSTRRPKLKKATSPPDSGIASFLPAVTYHWDGGAPGNLMVVDVNGDGRPDLLVSGLANDNTGSVGILLGNGN